MTTTGEKFPGGDLTQSESPWSNNNWTNENFALTDDGSAASITAATYDTNDRSYVLKVATFDFSSIPDGATINGVTCRVNAWYAGGSVSVDLLQLLNTSLVKVGTNKCLTPEPLTTSSSNVITKGSSSDTWGNSLTSAWVKNSNFGVAIGCLATGDNADVFVDYISLEIEYTSALMEYGAATLSGAGNLTASGVRQRISSAVVSGSGIISVLGGRIRTGTGTLTGTGVVSLVPSRIRTALAGLSGSGLVTIIGTITSGVTELGSATLSGVGQLSVSAGRLLVTTFSPSGAGSIVISGRKILLASISPSGVGNIVVSGLKILGGKAVLSGLGQMSSLGSRVRRGSSTLLGTGLLSVKSAAGTLRILLSGAGGLSVGYTFYSHLLGKVFLTTEASRELTIIASLERHCCMTSSIEEDLTITSSFGGGS